MHVTRTARRWVWGVWEVLCSIGPMAVIQVSLKFEDLPTTCRRMAVSYDLDSSAPPASRPALLARRRRRAVLGALTVVSLWPVSNTCLRRCLLVGHRIRDLGPVLRIGVRRDENGDFGAHSWLEIDGCTLDPESVRFATVGSLHG
jgi:Transglutaminase-like superfamily